jgi:putative ABC transport system permease protein
MRGTLRWARADLRARRGQALITIAVVAGVVAALFLATMLLQGAVNPWQQLFARTRGADVLVYFASGTNTTELRSVPGVQAVGKPYQAASATLEQGAVKSPVELRAMTPGAARDVRAAHRGGKLAAVLGAGRRGPRGVVRPGRARRGR